VLRRTLRFRLLRRRLTISAPRMAIRSALPWPIRWAGIALVLGFCAAIGLWAFEFGKDIAGVDKITDEEVRQLRAEVARLRQQREQAQSASNTSGSLLTVEKATQERLAAQSRALEAENRRMRDDLAFFEHLLPAGGAGISIRALQAEVLDGSQLKWQVLVMQPAKHAPEFRGKLEIGLTGTLDGQPWSMNLPGGAQQLQFRQYRRAEGAIDLPASAVVKNVTAKVVEGAVTRAVQTTKL
jgi:hypothetical protein